MFREQVLGSSLTCQSKKDMRTDTHSTEGSYPGLAKNKPKRGTNLTKIPRHLAKESVASSNPVSTLLLLPGHDHVPW